MPRDPYEKIADAAQVHLLTGLAPSVALHIPWDRVDDFDKLRRHADDLGVRLGTINTNTFQDDDYKLGSLCHVDERVRDEGDRAHARVRRHHGRHRQPRPEDLAARRPQLSRPGRPARPAGAPRRLAAPGLRPRSATDQRLVLEYKFFEPAFYATDVPDWGTAYVHCVALGERAVVCLDTGHHAPGTNIEFIVMQLLRLGRLGSFDFNSRFYADDDLIVGAADPFQLFRILFEVVRGGGYDDGSDVAFMLDQCHNIEAKIPGQIRSVLNVQEMTARALLVDRAALARGRARGRRARRERGDDGRVLHRRARRPRRVARRSRGLPADPIEAYRRSGYAERIVADRVGGDQAGWGADVTDCTTVVEQLLDRSHRLGADPRNTNYAGGNTSAKGTDSTPSPARRSS